MTGGGSGGSSGVLASGCFAGATYVSPPFNALDTLCGSPGDACLDCAQRAQACDAVTHTCRPRPDGGFSGATGGGAAGGGTGGGPGCSGCWLPVSGFCVDVANTSVVNCGINGSACVSCPSGSTCTKGVCRSLVDPAGKIGAGCQNDSDCDRVPGGAGFCKLLAVPSGARYAQGLCTRRCVDSMDCGTGNACVYWLGPQGEVENLCYQGCASSTCRAGYDCVDVSLSSTPRLACLPPGVLVDAGPGSSAAAGGPCTRDSQCGPAPYFSCTPERTALGKATNYPGGACTGDCSLTLDDAWCGDGGVCLPFITLRDARGPLVQWSCGARCTPGASPSGCRTGYVCQAGGAGGASGFCTPDCRQAPASFCSSCDTATGLCN